MFSSMTAKEEFRITGAVTGAKLETLLDKEDQLEAIDGVDAHISEAMGQYPAEDFLSQHQTRLNDLLKRLRGDNRETLLHIIEGLEDIAQCTFNAADYGRHELREALKALKGTPS